MKIMILNEKDNVAVALEALEAGDLLAVPSPRSGEMPLKDAIPIGHKVALDEMEPGQAVRKYGEVIGLATRPICPGEHVHDHNVESQRGRGDRA